MFAVFLVFFKRLMAAGPTIGEPHVKWLLSGHDP